MWHILPTLAIKMLWSTAGEIRKIDLILIEHTKVHTVFFYFCHFFAAVADALFLTSIPSWDIISITAFNKNTADF